MLRFHTHGPCGRINPKCPCMENNVCTKHYPKQFCKSSLEGDDGIAQYRRRAPQDKGQSVESKFKKTTFTLTNRNVVPYNAALLMKYQCHMNLEIASGRGRMIKYLYKYILKGPDYVSFKVVSSSSQDTSDAKQQSDANVNEADAKAGRNEIDEYVSARYLAPPECAWRIFGFIVYLYSPQVVRTDSMVRIKQARSCGAT